MGEKFGGRSSLHLSSVGWQALGLAANDLYFALPELDDSSRDAIIKEIAGLDWSRNNKDMVKFGLLTEVDGQLGMSGRGAAAVEALHPNLADKTTLGKKLHGVTPLAEPA